ncbi:MAG: ParA family protein [Hyphomicrobium sp.]
MALRLAIANLKGGVGKSTTTLFLSEALAVFHDLRVLVIDLDPQSNTSFMLLSRDGLESAEGQGRTLPHFLLDLENAKKTPPSLQAYICGQASDLTELKAGGKRGRVDLLPSVPRLWFVESLFEKRYYMQDVDPGAELRLTLSRYLDPLDAWYDLIIFDCPPGVSALTRAGILGADVIISPTIADAVSLRSLSDFVDIGLGQVLQIKKSLPHFVIISKYQANATDQLEVDRLKKRHDVLDPPIPLTKAMTKATERPRFDAYRSFKETYGKLEADVRLLTDRVYRYAIVKHGGKS